GCCSPRSTSLGTLLFGYFLQKTPRRDDEYCYPVESKNRRQVKYRSGPSIPEAAFIIQSRKKPLICALANVRCQVLALQRTCLKMFAKRLPECLRRCECPRFAHN